MSLKRYPNTRCISCQSTDLALVYDFGNMPAVNSFVEKDKVGQEPVYPMELMVCEHCKLIQLLRVPPPQVLFSKYDHFSGASAGNRQHLSEVAENATSRFAGRHLNVLEIGCNDATLLRNLARLGHDTVGVDPAENVYDPTIEPTVEVICDFFNEDFGKKLGAERKPFDLIIGLNVFAHNTAFLSAIKGASACLSDTGRLWVEVAYAPQTIADGNFDTIYHEHVCSFTLYALEKSLELAGLKAVDAERIPTQGGSIRVLAGKIADAVEPSEGVLEIRRQEQALGVADWHFYECISEKISTKAKAIEAFFRSIADKGQRIILIGAPARGVVIANVCGFRSNSPVAALDDTQEKIGKYIPGTEIPVLAWSDFIPDDFDHAIVLSWNYADYLVKRLRDAGFSGPVTIPIPEIFTHR